ncbi:MAG: Fic family protein [Azoarcus sp.]|jgi:Fic family protein|nr:Fic family protein [Azoarcus sp.]
MQLETFKAGNWQPRYQYKSFEPAPVNHDWTWEDPRISVCLESATHALGELNAFSRVVPDVDLFIRMHIVKEAQTSSRIEGTQTSMNEALMPESYIAPEKRNDWREVQNYIAALNTAIERLASLPLSNRLLKETHAILMRGVRGEKKHPGEFRVSQNWIGGSSLANAAFIPPYHTGIPDLMGDLEQFWHNDAISVPHLIRVAISHYQFETIHPFLDGNGRIGRLLIPLYLVNHGLLARPSLYISDFFERNRANYYNALTLVRENDDLIHWVRFFLRGVWETATKGSEVFHRILLLRAEAENKIQTLGRRAASAHAALDVLYRNPLVSARELEQKLGVSHATMHQLIKDLMRLDILVETTGQARDRLYSFGRYLDLFTEGMV